MTRLGASASHRAAGVLLMLAGWQSPSQAAPTAAAAVADRAVVRFLAPEMGGARAPRFIFERELAFEARLEALSDPHHEPSADQPFLTRHVRSAMERHMAETLLESLEVQPPAREADVLAGVEAALLALYQRVGGEQQLRRAATAEGLDPSEVRRMLRRQARASIYLDRMVAPMFDPTDRELRALLEAGRTPYTSRPFAKVREELRRWYVGGRLGEAVVGFFESARSRLTVVILK